MPDVLPVTIIVPQKLNDVAKIKMLLGNVEFAYQMAGWKDLQLVPHLEWLNNPDGVVYAARFSIRTNLIKNSDLKAMALQKLNTANRRAYVIFICDLIVEADTMRTDTFRPTGTNGESITGQAISFLSLISSKSTVGNADGRTWAHEVGHGLGLEHIDNEANMMSPSRHGQGGALTGFDISQAQVDIMKATYQKLVNVGF